MGEEMRVEFRLGLKASVGCRKARAFHMYITASSFFLASRLPFAEQNSECDRPRDRLNFLHPVDSAFSPTCDFQLIIAVLEYVWNSCLESVRLSLETLASTISGSFQPLPTHHPLPPFDNPKKCQSKNRGHRHFRSRLRRTL